MEFSQYLNEATLNREVVNGLDIEPLIKSFWKTLSEKTHSFQKEMNPDRYSISCGKIYDPDSHEIMGRSRPYMILTDRINTSMRRTFYYLKLDPESMDVIHRYREFKDKDVYGKYLLAMRAKMNICNILREAGFSVKKESPFLVASINHPDMSIKTRRLGFISMNTVQNFLVKNARKTFKFEKAEPGNTHSVILLNAVIKEGMLEEYKDSIPLDQLWEKVEVCFDGTVIFGNHEHVLKV